MEDIQNNEKMQIYGNIIKKRYDNIDLLKVIAIFAVVSLHSGLFITDFYKIQSIPTYIQYGVRLVAEGVPLFILVNGFLLIDKSFDLKKHLIKILKIIIIIIIWSVILISTKTFINGECFNVTMVIENILKTDINNKYTGVLWFLQDLIKLYLIFPVIKVLHDKDKKMYNYIALIIFICVFGVNLLEIIIKPISYILNKDKLNLLIVYINKYNPFNNMIFLSYFILGGYLKEYNFFEKHEKKVYILGLLSFIIAVLYGYGMSFLYKSTYKNNYNYSQIFLMVTFISLFVFSKKYKSKGNLINKLITSIAKNTMGIYLIHTIIISVINNNILIKTQSFAIRLIITLVVLIFSYIITIIISKIPKINFLVKL